MQQTVRAGAWKGIAELTRRLGGDPAEIFSAVGLPDDLLDDPNTYHPQILLLETLDAAARILNRPDFGLLSGEYSPTDIGAITLGVMNSPTIREAVHLASRFIHVHNRGIIVDLVPDDRTGHELISVDALNPLYSNSVQVMERQIAGLCMHLKNLQGDAYNPVEIRMSHPQLAPSADYRAVLGMTPVFNCETGGVVMTTEALDAQRPGCDEDILKLVETRLSAMGEAPSATLSLKVEMLIRGLLPGTPCSMPRIATILGMHERTLQRRLRDEGVSFEQLKDRVKRRRAEALLAREDVSLTDVAFMLGYSESATFSRKARDWFGVPPRDYRQQLLSGDRA